VVIDAVRVGLKVRRYSPEPWPASSPVVATWRRSSSPLEARDHLARRGVELVSTYGPAEALSDLL